MLCVTGLPLGDQIPRIFVLEGAGRRDFNPVGRLGRHLSCELDRRRILLLDNDSLVAESKPIVYVSDFFEKPLVIGLLLNYCLR